MNSSVKIVVPTLNGGALFQTCISRLSDWHKDLLVIDSGSNDGTVEFLEELKIRVVKISQEDFNHGATREYARKLVNSDMVVFLTQDAILKDRESIDRLIAPLVSGLADVCYGRQFPALGAGFFERFPREFNYPTKSHVRSIRDTDRFGSYTFFCSNAFSAYSQEALDEIGGFAPTLSHEDYFAVGKILMSGGRIAYVAEAEVQHSHNYTFWQEFQRYFDAGYVRAGNPWVTRIVGQAENHGSRFFKEMISRLAAENPSLIPYGFLQTFVKWFGYRIGYLCFKGPRKMKEILSGQSYYFRSKYYVAGEN